MDLGKLLGFGRTQEARAGQGALFDGIQAILETYPEEEVKLITGYAGLLGNIAYADHEISETEIARIRQVLSEQLDLSVAQVDVILEILLKHRVQLFTVENHHYARLVNAVTGKERRKQLLRLLFSLTAVDNSISAEEDTGIRLVANALKLTHDDFVTIRAEFKRHRDVFKD